MDYGGLLSEIEAPVTDDPIEVDVRDLPPPEPLQETLGTLESMDEGECVIQINDRKPQHLFPMLEERGFTYESTGDDPVYTAIWTN